MSFHINSRLAKLGTFINTRTFVNTRYTRLNNPASDDSSNKSMSHSSDKDDAPLLSTSGHDTPVSDPPSILEPSTSNSSTITNDNTNSSQSTSPTYAQIDTTDPEDDIQHEDEPETAPTPISTNDQVLPSTVQSRNPAIIAEAASQAAAAGANQAISISANNTDSRIMGEYNYRANGGNGNYIGMREHAQMIASARQSALNNHVAHTKLGLIFGGLVGGLTSYFVGKHRYENGGRDKYLKDYNFKTLNRGDGTRIDPRDHETATSIDDNVARSSPSPAASTPVPGMSSGAEMFGSFRQVSPNPVLTTSTGSQTNNRSFTENTSTQTDSSPRHANASTQTNSSYHAIFYDPQLPTTDISASNDAPSYLSTSHI